MNNIPPSRLAPGHQLRALPEDDMDACVWCSRPLAKSGLCGSCFAAWPKCAIEVCQNKACLRLNSVYCWPHTPTSGQSGEVDESLKQEEADSALGDLR